MNPIKVFNIYTSR